MAQAENALDLNIEACIGFTGSVIGGLKCTPCGNFVLYPLGKMMIVRSLSGNKMAFLEGHNGPINCVAMSKDGSRLATGQNNDSSGMIKADVIVWDLDLAIKECTGGKPRISGAIVHRLSQHMGKVQAVDFSYDGEYLASLGGQDDNSVVVWDLEQGRSICGAPAAQDSALGLKWLNCRNDRLVTCGNYHLRVWQVDVSLPKLHAMDAKIGGMRRVMTCVSIDDDDEYGYCGTKTGDLLKFKIDRDGIQNFNDPDHIRPFLQNYSRDKFSKGLKAVACLKNPETGNTNILCGAGDGSVAFMNPHLNKVYGMSTELSGGITSLSISSDRTGFFVGTDLANRLYWVDMNMESELRGTSHHARINDVVFPKDCSSLFVTCSTFDIRVWNAKLKQELLRIQVPNLECTCVGITSSGATIVSGWLDGKIRAFYPESGKLKFVITDAHTEGVTALAIANDDDSNPPWRIISGGADGRVRVWNVTSSHQAMTISWKEHRGPVTCLQVSRDNSQCISGSADGSCIVWDLERGVRILAMFEPTVFKSVLYHPDESQYLTCGSNHKISYWDAYDGSAIRVIDGGDGEMTALDVERSGVNFVSGSLDNLVKVWHYDDGVITGIGVGHTAQVNAVRISPDQRTIVSVGEEGGIFIWEMPPTEA
ncbi:unnamed protein product [Chrysoparadoxa australica]